MQQKLICCIQYSSRFLVQDGRLSLDKGFDAAMAQDMKGANEYQKGFAGNAA